MCYWKELLETVPYFFNNDVSSFHSPQVCLHHQPPCPAWFRTLDYPFVSLPDKLFIYLFICKQREWNLEANQTLHDRK